MLADDPGAGKTIMAGLLIRELLMRADAKRVLIVAPGSLVEQWQDEMFEKFGLSFTLFSREQVMAAYEIAAKVSSYVMVERMVKEFDRNGRAAGAGFYEYPQEKGAKKFLWPELARLFGRPAASWEMQDLKDRLLYRQAVETARCLSEGVLTTVHDANIGSIFGIGFPAWTGGAMQFIYGMGVDAFARRADALAQRFGPGFALGDAVLATIRQHTPRY